MTGNTSGSAATFTGALAGDVTGTQAATVLQPTVLFGKTLQATFVPVTGTVSIGDTLEAALEKTTANITDTVNKTSTNASAITALDVTVSNLTARVTTAETDINNVETNNTTQDNAITAIQGVNTTQGNSITALQTKVNNLTSVSNVTLTGTNFSATIMFFK